MRQNKKNEIIEILETMAEGINQARQAMERAEVPVELLADLQETAIAVGNYLETEVQLQTDIIHNLEQLCERLYDLSIFPKEQISGDNRILEELQTSYYAIYEEIQRMPVRREILFLPYKASMWDSMESIWKAADRDQSCDCYVIPVPFFERVEGSKQYAERYEGNLLPAYVSVTDYKSFDIPARKPDVIYIHNPYDDSNLVTMVHPSYFSRELKKHTDMLVYVPYYLNGSGPMSPAHLDLPVYRYADYIILQDEGKRKSLTDCVPESKIAVLGSPKVDHLLELEAGKHEVMERGIPKEWKRKISGKKVFLYNVSISGILENSRYALEKIKYVLSCFDSRADAVLLWRPHPLLEATLKSMRPEMYAEYMELKRQFQEKDMGILDNMPDGAISTVISDAYIGEMTSSMVCGFELLSKHIFIINWRLLNERTEEERKTADLWDCYPEGNDIYFIPDGTGREYWLCRLNLADGKVCVEARLPGKERSRLACISLRKVKEKLVLIPYNARDIYIYNLKTGAAVKLPLLSECAGDCFDLSVVFEDSLFLKPKRYPAIVKLNVDTLEYEEFHEPVEPFEEEGNIKFLWGVFQRDNLLYISFVGDSRFLIFDMRSGGFIIKRLPFVGNGAYSAVWDGRYAWLSLWKQNRIIRWEVAGGESCIVEYEYPLKNEAEYIASVLADMGKEIWILPHHERNIYALDKESGKIRFVKEESVQEGTGYLFVKEAGDSLLAFRAFDHSLCLIDKKTGRLSRYPVQFNLKDMLEAERTIFTDKEKNVPGMYRICEEENLGVGSFIDYVNNDCKQSVYGKRIYENFLANPGGSCGSEVHRFIMSSLSDRD